MKFAKISKHFCILAFLFLATIFFACKHTTDSNLTSTETFTISYSTEHGTCPASAAVLSGFTLTEAYLPNLTESGYTFCGWYIGNNSISVGYKVSSNITLTAKWSANSYTLSFDSNGGSGSMSQVSVTYGESVNLPANAFTYSGYTFSGWATSSSATSASYLDGATYTTGTSNVTLYALWEKSTVSYTVKHLLQNLDDDDYTVYEEETLSGVADGTTLAQAKSYSGFTAQPISQSTISADGSTSVNIYYTRNSYTITLDLNGGSGILSSYTGKYEATVSIDTSSLTKTGYILSGWTVNGTSASFPTTFTESATYTAQWEASSGIKYTVYHYKQNLDATTYELAESETLTGKTGEKTAAQAKSYSGFTAGTVSQNIISADGSTSVNIYYTRNSYTITLDLNGGSGISTTYRGLYEATVLIDTSSLTKTGYILSGWTVNGTSASLPTTFTESATYTAQWTANTYTLSFDSNGGSGIMSQVSVTYGESVNLPANTFTYTGYTFVGWATSSDGSVSYANNATYTQSSATNVTLYAVWAENGSHIITYKNVEGATNTNVSSFKETDTVTLVNATKTGYTFDGWYTDSDFTSSTTGWSAGIYSADITLYAKWSVNTYTVNFSANGGSGTMNPLTVEYGSSTSLTSNTFTYTGYTFSGWATSSSGSVVYADGATCIQNTTSDVTLYAVWTVNSYTVSFDANGGSGTMNPLTVEYGSSTSLTSNTFTYTGYTFSGWATSSSGNVVYADGTTYTQNTTSDVTLYAVWKAGTVSYTVNHYKMNVSGSGYTLAESESLTGKTGDKTVVQAKEYTGFTAQSVSQVTLAADSSSEVSVYYDRNTYTITLDLNGGSGIATTYSGLYEASVSISTSGLKKANCTFEGWNPDLPTTYTENSSHTAIWTYGTITATVASTSDISVSESTSGTVVTLSVDSSSLYKNFAWYVNGTVQSATSSTFEFDMSSKTADSYQIMVIACDGNKYYSASITVKVD